MIYQLWLAFLGIYPEPAMSLESDLKSILNEMKAEAQARVAFEQTVVGLLTDIKNGLVEAPPTPADVEKIKIVPGVPTQH